ncbi:hypothetical protein LCGC14_0381560 [marine sediment metagenome]|uniref:Uncharacterized protein n=1 Tax=marine sediment metagenome TaxID=412755 RepID=A0A0F9T819_9ZZZZ
MKDIIWKMPWALYEDYKVVREEIRNLNGYKKLKTRESDIMKSMFVVSVGGVGVLGLILFLAVT